MLDLFMKRAKKNVKNVIFMYYCPELDIDEKIIKYYEKRYGITIDRVPHPLIHYYQKNTKKITLTEYFIHLKRKYELRYLAFGYRKGESIFRTGEMANHENGINAKQGKLYPICDFSIKHVNSYVKKNKLVLPEGYKMGFRDINSFKGESLEYIYYNHQKDYQKIINLFPKVKEEAVRIGLLS